MFEDINNLNMEKGVYAMLNVIFSSSACDICRMPWFCRPMPTLAHFLGQQDTPRAPEQRLILFQVQILVPQSESVTYLVGFAEPITINSDRVAATRQPRSCIFT